jgi:hypothetical protein
VTDGVSAILDFLEVPPVVRKPLIIFCIVAFVIWLLWITRSTASDEVRLTPFLGAVK